MNVGGVVIAIEVVVITISIIVAVVVISIGNSTISRGIWDKYHE